MLDYCEQQDILGVVCLFQSEDRLRVFVGSERPVVAYSVVESGSGGFA